MGIVGGLAVGWFLPDYGLSLLLLALIIIVGLTIRNLIIAVSQWMRDPTQVEAEALANAKGDYKQFERVAQDVHEMKRLRRPTWGVICRYIGVCFALNFITVSLSAIPSLALRGLLKVIAH